MTQSRFWQAAPDFHGVIAEKGRWRVAVSPNGKRYLLQWAAPDGTFAVGGAGKTLGGLLKSAARSACDDWPGLLARLPAGLPHQASDYPRPWADEAAALRRRLAATSPDHEIYAGVLFRDGRSRWRVARNPLGSRFLIQERGRRLPVRWLDRVTGRRLSDVLGRARALGAPAWLLKRLATCPAFAADLGKEGLPELRGVVQASIFGPSRPRSGARGSVRAAGRRSGRGVGAPAQEARRATGGPLGASGGGLG